MRAWISCQADRCGFGVGKECLRHRVMVGGRVHAPRRVSAKSGGTGADVCRRSAPGICALVGQQRDIDVAGGIEASRRQQPALGRCHRRPASRPRQSIVPSRCRRSAVLGRWRRVPRRPAARYRRPARGPLGSWVSGPARVPIIPRARQRRRRPVRDR